MHICNLVSEQTMKRTFTILAFVLLAVVATVSCKKEEDETKPYLTGTVTFELPAYLCKGELFTVEASGISYPKEITYRWYSQVMAEDSVYANPATFRAPDSIGNFTLTATAYSPGYYTSAGSNSFITVDPSWNGSLRGIHRSIHSFTDNRDGRSYGYVRIGSLDWMTSNLAYDGAGISFMYSPAVDGLFGRFYTWNEATGGVAGSGLGKGPQGVCPAGWSVPTAEDWMDFASAVTGRQEEFTGRWEGAGEKASAPATFNDDRMWSYSPDNGHTNTLGWNGLPLGSCSVFNTAFSGYGKYGFWWSSAVNGSDKAWFRYIFEDENAFPAGASNRTDFAANVRCVRLAQ